MNWHLSTDPERPDDWDYCAVVIKQDNRHCLRASRIYSKKDDEFWTDDEYCETTKFKDTFAWISEDEILNNFREFHKRNKQGVNNERDSHNI